jgi:hypothetical protein
VRTIAPDVTAGERLQEILDELPEGWSEARLLVTIADGSQVERAAGTLASLGPGRSDGTFVVTLARGGVGGPSPEAARRVLERLDRDQIDVRLSLARREPVTARVRAEAARVSLAKRFDDIVAALPPDWSDLYLEVELVSSAQTDRAALLLAPVNPLLQGPGAARFRFRAARRFGYGAAPQMARRALARLDEEDIRGELRVLRVMCETSPVATQGPVWRELGRAV